MVTSTGTKSTWLLDNGTGDVHCTLELEIHLAGTTSPPNLQKLSALCKKCSPDTNTVVPPIFAPNAGSKLTTFATSSYLYAKLLVEMAPLLMMCIATVPACVDTADAHRSWDADS
jgi:hypothetical protein